MLVGNPEHPRVISFQRALAARGHPEAQLVSWLELARRPSVLRGIPSSEGLLRLESPGQSGAVTRLFLRLGEDEARREGVTLLSREQLRHMRPKVGQILAPRQRHLGFRHTLAQLELWLQSRPGWRAWPSPSDVARLFDKRWTSREYDRQGIPVPSPLEEVEHGVYVKLASGSSAACMALVRHTEIVTTVQQVGDELFNTRHPRTLRGQPAQQVLDFLLREGAQIERAVDKAELDGHPFDLRVVVVGDEPAFVIPRTSRGGPFTNLHLGGRRAEVEQVRALMGASRWDQALDTAVRVRRLHEVLHLGVDVVIERETHQPYVVEANAFGDWFPGLPVHDCEVLELERRFGSGSR